MTSYRIIFLASTATFALAAPYTQTQFQSNSGVFSVPVSMIKRTAGNIARARMGNEGIRQQTRGSGGDAPASPPFQEPDYEYIAPITIGKNTYNLVLDTGVTDTWVSKAAFKNLNSTCRAKKGYSWESPLAKGDIVCEDNVAVGDAAVDEQAVCVGTPLDLPDPYSDGVLGLAPGDKLSTIKPSPQKGWLANLLPTLKNPIFTLDLRHEAEGSITFGDIPKSVSPGKLQWTSLDTSNGKYTINSSGNFKIGHRHFSAHNKTQSAVIDTGTTLVFMSKTIVDAYYGSVQGSQFNQTAYGGWTLPCKGYIPTFSVTVGGHMVTIPSEHMSYFGVDFGNTTCYGGLQYHDDDSQPYIFGDTFIKSVYAVFNMGNSSVGIAPKTV